MDSTARDNKSSDRGVSPIIGVILLVAITVLLGGAFGTFVLDYGESLDDDDPLVMLALSVDYAANEITVEHTDGAALNSSDIRIIVSNGTTSEVFEPTDTPSTLSVSESATIDLSKNGGNRIDWDPDKTGWEYVQPGSFSGISNADSLEVRIVHYASDELLLNAHIPAVKSSMGATPTPDPGDPGHAFLDKNADGDWDSGTDEKIPDAEITDGVYDAGSEALVIPESVGAISATKIDLDGASVSVDVDLSATGNQDVSVTAGSGVLVIDGVTVDTMLGRQITLRGTGGVSAQSTTIDSGEAITVRSDSGEVDLTGASVKADEMAADITLRSNGDMSIESATITAQTGTNIDASLQIEDGPTLYVEGASITDGDDTLTYSPEDIEVDGTPSSGSVASG